MIIPICFCRTQNFITLTKSFSNSTKVSDSPNKFEKEEMLDKLAAAWVSKIFALCSLKDGVRFRGISQKFKTIAELPTSSPYSAEIGVKRRYQWNSRIKDTKDDKSVPALPNLSYDLLDRTNPASQFESVCNNRMQSTRQLHCSSKCHIADDGKAITLPPHLTDLSVTFADAQDYIANSPAWVALLAQLLPNGIAPVVRVIAIDSEDCEHKEKKQKKELEAASFNNTLTTLKMQSIQSTISTVAGPNTSGEWKWDILEHFSALTSLSVAEFDLNTSVHYLPPTITELEIPWHNTPIPSATWKILKKLPIRRLSLDPTLRLYNRVSYGFTKQIDKETLSNFASHLPHLEDFRSSWLNLSNVKDQSIHFPKLRQLSLSVTDLLSLGGMLKSNGQQLSRLQIANCELGPVSLYLNGIFLKPCTQLTHLAIRNCSIETASEPYRDPEFTPVQIAQNTLNARVVTPLPTLVSYLAKLGPQLTTLDLKNNQIAFTSEFSVLSNLTSLSLSHHYGYNSSTNDQKSSLLLIPLLPRLLHLSTLYDSKNLSAAFSSGEFWKYLPSLQSWTMLHIKEEKQLVKESVKELVKDKCNESTLPATKSLLHFKIKRLVSATTLCRVIENHPQLRSLKLPSYIYSPSNSSVTNDGRGYPVSPQLSDFANTRGVELLGRHYLTAI